MTIGKEKLRLEHKLLLIGATIFYGLWTTGYGLLYAQEDNLEVRGEVRAQALSISGGDTFPAAPVKGEIFYRSDVGQDQYYIFDGTSWEAIGGQDKLIATRVVAAADSDLTDRAADYICDGTDDQQTIQQAIDALGNNPGAVYLLEGNYNISASINLDNTSPVDSAKAIIGAGRGTVLTAASGVNVINASGVNSILIAQLMINGNAAIGGIYFVSVTNSKVHQVWVEDVSGIAIYLNQSDSNTILDNHISGCNSNAIQTTNSYRVNISNNVIVDNEAMGIRIYSGGDMVIAGNNIQNSACNGIQLYSSSFNTVNANVVKGSDANGCGGNIVVCGGGSNIITGNIAEGALTYRGISIVSGLDGSSDDNTLSGNIVRNNARGGIALIGANRNIVSGNAIFEISENGPAAVEYLHGIYLNEASANIIYGNRIQDTSGTAGYGISLYDNTCVNNYLGSNFIDGAGFSTRIIQDNGIGTKYTDKIKLAFEPAAPQDPGAGGLINPGPATYIPLDPASNYTLSNVKAIEYGKYGGDLLILENKNAVNTITIPNNAGTKLKGALNKALAPNEMLELVWDAAIGVPATCCWVQIGGKE
jgi:parallel beta-helix repeat protein